MEIEIFYEDTLSPEQLSNLNGELHFLMKSQFIADWLNEYELAMGEKITKVRLYKTENDLIYFSGVAICLKFKNDVYYKHVINNNEFWFHNIMKPYYKQLKRNEVIDNIKK